MKPTLLLLLTAMSCVAQTDTNIDKRLWTHYDDLVEPGSIHKKEAQTNTPTLHIDSKLWTNYISIGSFTNTFIEYFKVSRDYTNITILSTNTIIKCTPGLSPTISKDTNGLWTVEFRKE